MRIRTQRPRNAVAAVEFAFVAPVLVVLMLGLWEVGRMIQLQQTLANAAREGGRVAAQGLTINSAGSPTQIHVSTGTPNVKSTVYYYLKQNGLNVSLDDVTVDFVYITGDTTKTQPYEAIKGQQFKVTVTIPTANLRWMALGPFMPTTLTASAIWSSVVDDPFALDTNIPNW